MKNTLLLFCLSVFFANNSTRGQVCPQPFKVVVLGSSTSEGVGASTPANAYVALFQNYLETSVNAGCEIINLAVGGTTTYNIQPNSFTPPAPFTVNPSKNIDAAISENPDAILINFPSNDAANDIPIAEQKNNFTRVVNYAASHNIPVWVTSTQPRNFSQARRDMLIEMRDWLEITFGSRYIDFWTGIANADGTINAAYNSGDNVHLNDAGHALLFERVKNSTLVTDVCYAILPIITRNLTLKGDYENVILTWNAEGLEPGKFVIECSKNGNNTWISVTEMNAWQNGQPAAAFSYVHQNALHLGSTLYYRIAAVHLNGNTTYSDTQRIQLNSRGLPYLVHSSGQKIYIKKITTQKLHYILYDTFGRMIDKNVLPEEQKTVIPTSHGIYILRIWNESGQTWTVKIAI